MDPWEVTRAFTLGPLLEVTVPKPGNVNRYRDFDDLSIYHFMFGNVFASKILYEAAIRGNQIKKGERSYGDVGIGELIKEAFKESKSAQSSNANFGIITLAIPLAVACSISDDVAEAGGMASFLIENSTPEDTIEFYKAVRMANPSGLRRDVKYDVYKEDVFEELRRDEVNLKIIAEIECDEELIFCEWLKGYGLSYEVFMGMKDLIKNRSFEDSVIEAFLNLLSQRIDTLVARKAGLKEAERVREMARKVLDGFISLDEYDAFLRGNGHRRNPGSLADIMAIALSLLVLDGYRLGSTGEGNKWTEIRY